MRDGRAADNLGLGRRDQRCDDEERQDDRELDAGAGRQVERRVAVRAARLVVRSHGPADEGGARRGPISVVNRVGRPVLAVGMPALVVVRPVALRPLARAVPVMLTVVRGAMRERRPGSGEARQERQ